MATAPQNACYAAIYGENSHTWHERAEKIAYVVKTVDGTETRLDGKGLVTLCPAGSAVFDTNGTFVGVAVDGISSHFTAAAVQVTGAASLAGDWIDATKRLNCVGEDLRMSNIGFCIGRDTADGKLASDKVADWTRVSLTR